MSAYNLLFLRSHSRHIFSKGCILILLLSPLVSKSQNLVPNPSFEEMHWENPPFEGGFQSAVIDWDGYLTIDIHYDGKGATGMNTHPGYGYQQPYHGTAMAGIRAFDFSEYEWHEIIFTQLLDTLITGELYFVSFWVSPNEGVQYVTDDIGLYFSADTISNDRRDLFDVKPQIVNPEGNYLDDVTAWYEISGYYKAKGGEKNLFIGTFKRDADITYIESVGQYNEGAYFFVDHVVVEKCPIPICLDLRDTTLCEGELLTLDVSTPEATYLWNDGNISQNHTIKQPGKYWVEITAEGCAISDTMLVEYTFGSSLLQDTLTCNEEDIILDAYLDGFSYQWNDGTTNSTLQVSTSGVYSVISTSGNCVFYDTINVNYLNENLAIIPNPNNGSFSIKNQQEVTDWIKIYDSTGRLLLDVVSNPIAFFDLQQELSADLYFVTISSGGCTATEKMVVVKSD